MFEKDKIQDRKKAIDIIYQKNFENKMDKYQTIRNIAKLSTKKRIDQFESMWLMQITFHFNHLYYVNLWKNIKKIQLDFQIKYLISVMASFLRSCNFIYSDYEITVNSSAALQAVPYLKVHVLFDISIIYLSV